jgi:hypothetical protein
MKIDIETKRLKAIRLKPVLFPKKCSCCGNYFQFEKMFHVQRSGINRTIHDWFYCKNCTPTAKDVLHQIDTDSCYFGIAFVDDGRDFKKVKPTPPNTGSSVIKKAR